MNRTFTGSVMWIVVLVIAWVIGGPAACAAIAIAVQVWRAAVAWKKIEVKQ